MADSLREHGQLAPIRVRWSDELGKWVIIAGERRWRAAKLAGLPAIECYFHADEMSPSEVLEQQLIENLLREDLKPVEEARAYAALMELNGWTGKQVAERLRVPAPQVSRALALLRLPDDIRQRVDAGEIAARAGYEQSKLENADHQRQLADRAAADNLTHEETARLVRQHRGKRRRHHRASPCHTRLCFPTEQGWEVIVSAPRKPLIRRWSDDPNLADVVRHMSDHGLDRGDDALQDRSCSLTLGVQVGTQWSMNRASGR